MPVTKPQAARHLECRLLVVAVAREHEAVGFTVVGPTARLVSSRNTSLAELAAGPHRLVAHDVFAGVDRRRLSSRRHIVLDDGRHADLLRMRQARPPMTESATPAGGEKKSGMTGHGPSPK